MATDPTLQHGGVGSAVVGALCADLQGAAPTGEISWVSNLRFYGKCGARVSRVFLGGKLSLSTKWAGVGRSDLDSMLIDGMMASLHSEMDRRSRR